MHNIVFLGSGGGGNMRFVYSVLQTIPIAKVTGCIVDRDCGAQQFAMNNGIPTVQLSFKRNETEDAKLIDMIRQMNADLIITNVHKILSPRIVTAFGGRLINLHYSYLPAFGGLIGMAPVDQAIKRNNRFVGCTSHFVNEAVDDGKTIAQGIFPTALFSENIYQKTFECGALTLCAALLSVLQKDDSVIPVVTLEGIQISPGHTMMEKVDFRQIFESLKS